MPDAVHSERELQSIFEALKLGTERDRERFRQLTSGFEAPTEAPKWAYELHFTNTSESGTAIGDAFSKKEEEHAQLARDPE